MIFKKRNFKKMVDKDFQGSMTKCAKRLGVAVTTLTRIYSENRKPGRRTLEKIIKYCLEMGYNCADYISFAV